MTRANLDVEICACRNIHSQYIQEMYIQGIYIQETVQSQYIQGMYIQEPVQSQYIQEMYIQGIFILMNGNVSTSHGA
jgi:hypothetical protein